MTESRREKPADFAYKRLGVEPVNLYAGPGIRVARRRRLFASALFDTPVNQVSEKRRSTRRLK
jgi:hypothetical protein